VLLAETLLSHWPGSPARVLFATGGSDAIEIALKLARVATGRFETLSIEGSYHGDGFAALGLAGASHDARLGPLLPGRHHVTPYWVDADRMVAETRACLDSRTIAAVVAEPMRSSCHVPPDGLWREIRRLCDAAGTKLIFDEIPSGLGKTGRFFAFEHFDAVPDAVVLGKALGGGVVPIAAVIADATMDVAPELALGHYTHEKNPLTSRAALETRCRDGGAAGRACGGNNRAAAARARSSARAATAHRLAWRGGGVLRCSARRRHFGNGQGRVGLRPFAAADRERRGDRARRRRARPRAGQASRRARDSVTT
jgi:4-aminobutyrate aminotransferase